MYHCIILEITNDIIKMSQNITHRLNYKNVFIVKTFLF